MSQSRYPFLRVALGVTLIELMVSLVLSLMIMGFLLELYVESQRSNQLRIVLNQVQSNAKTAIALIESDISKAGYVGCARLEDLWLYPSYASISLTPKNKLEVENQATIIVRYASYASALLIRPIEKNRIIYTSNDVQFSAGEVLLISDCKQAEMFKVENSQVAGKIQKLTSVSPLQMPFSPYAEVSRIEINTYYVGKTSRKDGFGSIIYALYKQDREGKKRELVEGIKEMKIYKQESQGKLGVTIVLHMNIYSMQKNWYAYVTA